MASEWHAPDVPDRHREHGEFATSLPAHCLIGKNRGQMLFVQPSPKLLPTIVLMFARDRGPAATAGVIVAALAMAPQAAVRKSPFVHTVDFSVALPLVCKNTLFLALLRLSLKQIRVVLGPFGRGTIMAAAHLPALDGLRGFAALVVVVSHCAAAGFLPDSLTEGLGQMGVAVFFALSGFLMAHLYCDERLTLASLREYAFNRATRVLPLFYLVAIFVAVCFIAFDYSFLKVFSWKHIFGNMFLLKGSSVLWTIPVEVHFYVIFVGLWFAANSGRFFQTTALLVTFQLSTLMTLYLVGIDYSPILFSWLHLFLFGSLIGAYHERLQRSLDNSKYKVVFAAFAWLVFALMVIAPPQVRRDIGIPTSANFLDPITVGFPILIWACTALSLGPFSVFKQPILRWYGKISYSLYLLHLFVVYGVTAMVESDAISAKLGFPIVLALATLLAAASYYAIEHPAQRRLRHMLRNCLLRGSGAA